MKIKNKMQEKNNIKNDIFENLRKKYLENMSEEEKEAYKKFGEKFHSIDFTKQNIDPSKIEINLEESLANIVRQLNSGLHPSYIDADEEHLLKSAYGEKWYEKWGYKSKTYL